MISKNEIKLIRSLALRKNRKSEGLFVAERPKVVGDLVNAGWKPVHLYDTEGAEGATPITEEELRRASFLQHPQRMLGVFRLPEPTTDEVPLPRGLCLALDGIQDPGNVGTIIRIADWFGIRDLYCSEDSADAFGPKAVQASMGSIAHVNIIRTDLSCLVDRMPQTTPVYGLLLDGSDIYTASLETGDALVVMGSEGNGISEALRARINRRLLIPSFNTSAGRAESLNVSVATAIACSEFRRRGL